MMNTQSKARWITLAAAAALAAASVGCHNSSHSERQYGDRFEDDQAPRAYRNAAAVQASTGARADATLHDAHFNAAGLNSLGRQKLDLMLADDEAMPPLVVYIDLPKGSNVAQARTAVANYLSGRGVADSQFKIEEGPNPKTLHRAEENMAALESLKNAQNSNAQGGQQAGNTTGYSSQPNSASATPASH